MFKKKKNEIFENIFCCRKKIKKICLVLPVKDISFQPELSSPPRFPIQGGQPESDTGGVVVAGQDPFCLILDVQFVSISNHIKKVFRA